MSDFVIYYEVPDDHFVHAHAVKAENALDAVADLFEFEDHIRLTQVVRDGEVVWPGEFGA